MLAPDGGRPYDQFNKYCTTCYDLPISVNSEKGTSKIVNTKLSILRLGV